MAVVSCLVCVYAGKCWVVNGVMAFGDLSSTKNTFSHFPSFPSFCNNFYSKLKTGSCCFFLILKNALSASS